MNRDILERAFPDALIRSRKGPLSFTDHTDWILRRGLPPSWEPGQRVSKSNSKHTHIERYPSRPAALLAAVPPHIPSEYAPAAPRSRLAGRASSVHCEHV